MARIPDIDEAVEGEWEQADLDGWPKDFFYEEIKTHPPESFRDKSNGE
jgi:hypothetical protein